MQIMSNATLSCIKASFGVNHVTMYEGIKEGSLVKIANKIPNFKQVKPVIKLAI